MQSDMNTVINKDYMLMRIFLQPFPLFSISIAAESVFFLSNATLGLRHC